MNRKQGRYASIRFLNALGAITCAYGSDSTADPSPCQPFRYVSCTQISFVRATDDRAALSFRTSFSYLRVRCELSPRYLGISMLLDSFVTRLRESRFTQFLIIYFIKSARVASRCLEREECYKTYVWQVYTLISRLFSNKNTS